VPRERAAEPAPGGTASESLPAVAAFAESAGPCLEQEGSQPAEVIEEPANHGMAARSAADKVGEEAPTFASSSHSKEPHSSAEACEPFLDNDLDDDDEEEVDEAELWAMTAPDPPAKAPPVGSPHYRVMAPPRADLLPPMEPFPPSSTEEIRSPPEVDRERAEEVPSESEPQLPGDSATSRVPVKAMPGPGREGGASSSAASPWPVGKAAAGRFKAPPAICSSSASSSEPRRPPMEMPGGEDGARASALSVGGEAPAGPTSSVKAPPAQRCPASA